MGDGNTHGPDRHRQRLGKRCIGKGQAAVDYCHVTVGHHHLFGKGPGKAHADQLSFGAKVRIAGCAVATGLAADQRIDGNGLAGMRAVHRRTNSLMPQNQGRYATRILAMPGMHVRTADSAKSQINKGFATARPWRIGLAYFTGLGTGIEKRLHFAVKPPSTINTCPVT